MMPWQLMHCGMLLLLEVMPDSWASPSQKIQRGLPLQVLLMWSIRKNRFEPWVQKGILHDGYNRRKYTWVIFALQTSGIRKGIYLVLPSILIRLFSRTSVTLQGTSKYSSSPALSKCCGMSLTIPDLTINRNKR